MTGSPPVPPLPTRDGPAGRRRPSCPPGSWLASLQAAGSRARLEALSVLLLSPERCRRLFLPLSRASPPAPRDIPKPAFPSRCWSPSRRQPRQQVGQGAGGGTPLGALDLEPGQREPWTPGDARSPQPETAASAVSARKSGEAAGGRGGAQLGFARRILPWQ